MDAANDIVERIGIPHRHHGLKPSLGRKRFRFESDEQLDLPGTGIAQVEGTCHIGFESSCKTGYAKLFLAGIKILRAVAGGNVR